MLSLIKINLLNKVNSTWKIFRNWLLGVNIMNKGDEILSNDIEFYRNIYRSDKKYIDKKTGRPTSRAFTPRPKDDGMLSVNISTMTTPLESCQNNTIKFTVFLIKNTLVKSISLTAIYDPLNIIDDNIDSPAHSLIVGFPYDDESKAGILARSAF